MNEEDPLRFRTHAARGAVAAALSLRVLPRDMRSLVYASPVALLLYET